MVGWGGGGGGDRGRGGLVTRLQPPTRGRGTGRRSETVVSYTTKAGVVAYPCRITLLKK
jgi:hypothetical protein